MGNISLSLLTICSASLSQQFEYNSRWTCKDYRTIDMAWSWNEIQLAPKVKGSEDAGFFSTAARNYWISFDKKKHINATSQNFLDVEKIYKNIPRSSEPCPLEVEASKKVFKYHKSTRASKHCEWW